MKLEKKGRVGIIVLERPPMNILDSASLSELKELLSAAGKDEQIRVLIITGGKHFCAGADIKEMKGKDREGAMTFSRLGHSVCDAIEDMDKPVIAAVRGYALGAGCEIALACDIRIASEDAKFGQPEVNLGLIPGFGGTQRLPIVVGIGKARELILTGRVIDAAEAQAMGLVNGVVSGEILLEKAEETAILLAQKGPVAIKLAKKLMTEDRKSGKEMEVANFSDCFGTEDHIEGINAFLEKRKPEFKGK